jgi:hypothetical protein
VAPEATLIFSMSRRTLINLGLFALVALLTAIAIYEPGLQEQSGTSPPLTPLQPDEIHYIRLSNPGNLGIELEKRDGSWHMTAPRQAAANADKIGQLLGIATTSSHSHFPLPKKRLAEFGLETPSIRLQLNELVLEFGDNDPLQFRRYVRINEQLHLISNGFHHHLMAGADDYLAPTK